MSQYNNYKNKNIQILYIFAVAPYTGAWIEITFDLFRVLLLDGRTLHGCVDWNDKEVNMLSRFSGVAPVKGAWIEIILLIVLQI